MFGPERVYFIQNPSCNGLIILKSEIVFQVARVFVCFEMKCHIWLSFHPSVELTGSVNQHLFNDPWNHVCF